MKIVMDRWEEEKLELEYKDKINQVIGKRKFKGKEINIYARRCLKCNTVFLTESKFNRLCRSCKLNDYRKEIDRSKSWNKD